MAGFEAEQRQNQGCPGHFNSHRVARFRAGSSKLNSYTADLDAGLLAALLGVR